MEFHLCFLLFSLLSILSDRGSLLIRKKITANIYTLANIAGNINLGTKVKTGSYIGTGTSGPSYPNVLTFDFMPVLVIVALKNSYNSQTDTREAIFFMGRNTHRREWTYNGSNTHTTLHVSFDSNNISWYSSEYPTDGDTLNSIGAHIQYNTEDIEYSYIAIGL